MSNEWVEYGKTFREFKEEDFYTVGIVVQVEDLTYLIGDLNLQGGQCDCCKGLKCTDVVTRYKILRWGG